MKNPFELAPLIVAGLVGGFTLYALANDKDDQALAHGIAIGLAAQIAVRLLGVS